MSVQKLKLVKSEDKDWFEKTMKEKNPNLASSVIIVMLCFAVFQFYIVPLSVMAWQWWF